MRMRILGFFLGLAIVLLNDGCKKSESENKSQDNTTAVASRGAPAGPTILGLHWIGKKRLAADTNAVEFLKLWNLPESQKLEAQTLDKLSLLPWQTNRNHFLTNHPSAALLRPLLQDLLQEEAYLEVQQPSNKPAVFGLGVRLSDERARAWDTKLAAALQSLGGGKSVPRGAGGGWEVQLPGPARSERTEKLVGGNTRPHPALSPGERGSESSVRKEDRKLALTPALSPGERGLGTSPKPPGVVSVELARSGEWTIIGIGEPHNALVAQMLATVPSRKSSTSPSAGEPWLQLQAEIPWLVAALHLTDSVPTNLPHLALSIFGEGKFVRTHADLLFDAPLNLKLEDWQPPTNLVHDPLIGFSAFRGFQPLLESSKLWKLLGVGAAPNQAFFWAQVGFPSWHFSAMPAKGASNQVVKLSDMVLLQVNPLLQANKPKFGEFVRGTNFLGLSWKGIPWFSPTLRYAESGGTPFVFAGFSPIRATNKPAPSELWAQVYREPNLVYYDWELTSGCDEGLTQLAQLTRNVFGWRKITYSSSLNWLKALQPILGPSATGLSRMSPTHLAFHRKSTIGLTGVELELLADWLESPTFPEGLNTFAASAALQQGTNNWNAADGPPVAGTNAPAPSQPQIINIPAAALPTTNQPPK